MNRLIATALVACLPAGLMAATTSHPQAEQQALDLTKQAIALRSVRGPDNQAAKVAELFRSALIAGAVDIGAPVATAIGSASMKPEMMRARYQSGNQ